MSSVSMHRPISRRHPQHRRGFTLLEMVVVVTIIAILAALIVPRFMGQIGSARMKAAKAGATSIANTVSTYLIDTNQSAPQPDFDLTLLLARPGEAGAGPNSPYLQKAADLIDPWDNPYVIRVPGEQNYDFDIVSFGADGQPGGTGENADITQ